MAKFNACCHLGAIPVERLMRNDAAGVRDVGVRCTACQGYGATATMLKLCEPRRAKQRGVMSHTALTIGR